MSGLSFHRTSETLPEFDRPVVIKYKYSDDERCRYYICRLTRFDELDPNSPLKFEEFYGEQYSYWFPEEVEGWMYAEKLDNVPFEETSS